MSMSRTILVVMILVTIHSLGASAGEFAYYENRQLSIPGLQAAEIYYENVILELGHDGLFNVQSISDAKYVSKEHSAVYDQEEGILSIRFLSFNGSKYKDVRLRTTNEMQLEYLDSKRLFSPEVEKISTPKAYLPAEAGFFESITLQMVSAVDLNLDGLKDIVAHYWKHDWSAPDRHYEPVPNSLVVYLQNAEGSFSVGNSELFGKQIIDLGGGASRKQVIGDFNDDGYQDIAYAMNREDGRSWTNIYPGEADNWANRTAVVISNGDGTYRVDLLDPEAYFHTIDSATNESASQDIILSSSDSCDESVPSIAFRYVNGEAVRVYQYPNLQGSTASFLAVDDNQPHQLVAYRTACLDNPEIRLYGNSLSKWSQLDSFSFSPTEEIARTQRIPFQIENEEIYEIGGTKRLRFAFWESCSLSLYPDNPPIAIFQVTGETGETLPANFDVTSDVYEWDGDRNMAFLPFITGDAMLEYSPLVLREQDSLLHSYRFECVDKTHDGFDDLISYNYDGSITLYKNNQQGGLERTSREIFPPVEELFKGFENSQVRSIYEDMNGDGVLDVINYSNTPHTWSGAQWDLLPYNFVIHWGESRIFDSNN